MSYLIPLLLIIPLWFLFVRPQQRRLRAQQEMVSSLEVGDDVITSAGMYGTVVALDEAVATVEVAPGVPVRMARQAIGRRLTGPTVPGATPLGGHPTHGDDGTSPPVTGHVPEAE